MKNCDFSLKHYREILKLALKSGFVVTNFRDLGKIKKSSRVIILRHDIDAIPSRHLMLAKIEKSLGIKSTYFVRVHGQYYYSKDRKTIKILTELLKMGHEIGLHSEARSLSRVFRMSERDLFKSEKKYLEEILGVKIGSASEHGDLGRRADFWQDHFFKKISKNSVGIKQYPQEFKNFKYLSDSLGSWKEGCLCQNLSKFSKLQVLVHAEWWGQGARQEMIKLNKEYAKI